MFSSFIGHCRLANRNSSIGTNEQLASDWFIVAHVSIFMLTVIWPVCLSVLYSRQTIPGHWVTRPLQTPGSLVLATLHSIFFLLRDDAMLQTCVCLKRLLSILPGHCLWSSKCACELLTVKWNGTWFCSVVLPIEPNVDRPVWLLFARCSSMLCLHAVVKSNQPPAILDRSFCCTGQVYGLSVINKSKTQVVITVKNKQT